MQLFVFNILDSLEDQYYIPHWNVTFVKFSNKTDSCFYSTLESLGPYNPIIKVAREDTD